MKKLLEYVIVALAIGVSMLATTGSSKAQDLPPLLTPYVSESDMASIIQVFSTGPGAGAAYGSLGYIHDGLDISPKGNLKPFRAACTGRVQWVLVFDDGVNVTLECDSSHVLEYNFEPQSAQSGATQLANIAVVKGQTVAQGDVIGHLYVASAMAHVHFSVWKNWIPVCPTAYFDAQAGNSIANLVHVNFPGANTCQGSEAVPAPLVTPYVSELDMASINEAFSADGSSSPWGFAHDGIDFFPAGDFKPFRAACSGTVSSVQLRRNERTSNWQVDILIECSPYVPNNEGYFQPLTANYSFEPMSTVQAFGQTQLDNIIVAGGRTVAQGELIGYLHAAGAGAHVHFGLIPFASLVASGVPSIQICPEPHFSAQARNSILNLLHATWPGAGLCYSAPTAAISPQTGWWWNPAEGGRGFFIEFRGSNAFLAAFLYDPDGRATWYAAGGPIATAADAEFSGSLDRFSGGQKLSGAWNAPTAQIGGGGSIRLKFSDSQHGTLTWAGGSVAIQRFDFGGLAATAPATQPETGWWWNPAEPGRGFSIEIQGNSVFLAGYMYDENGNPVWYLPAGTLSDATTYLGSWQQFANGQTLTGAYQPASLVNAAVGSLVIRFTSTSTGLLTLPDGRQVAIERFRF